MTDTIENNYFLVSWRNLLQYAAQWDSVTAAKWSEEAAERFELSDPESWVYHKPPAYWVATAIAEKRLGVAQSYDEDLARDGKIFAALDFGAPDFTNVETCKMYRVLLDTVLQSLTPHLSIQWPTTSDDRRMVPITVIDYSGMAGDDSQVFCPTLSAQDYPALFSQSAMSGSLFNEGRGAMIGSKNSVKRHIVKTERPKSQFTKILVQN